MSKKIITFVFALFCLLTSSLNVKAADLFDVSISGISFSDDNTASSSSTSYGDNYATFSATFKLPGDSITYAVTIENDGSVEAILEDMTIVEEGSDAIVFEYEGVAEGDVLAAGATATLYVTITYSNSVTTQPDENEAATTITLEYVQNGEISSSGDTGSGGSGTTSGSGDSSGSFDILGVTVPNTVAYVSIAVIGIGLILVIVAIIVIRKMTKQKEEQNNSSSDVNVEAKSVSPSTETPSVSLEEVTPAEMPTVETPSVSLEEATPAEMPTVETPSVSLEEVTPAEMPTVETPSVSLEEAASTEMPTAESDKTEVELLDMDGGSNSAETKVDVNDIFNTLPKDNDK